MQSIARRERGVRSLGEKASQTPVIPGLHVRLIWNDKQRKVVIDDPLSWDDNESTRVQLQDALRHMPAACPPDYRGKIGGQKKRERDITTHEAKTFMKELRHYEKIERIRLVKGAILSEEQNDKLPGRYLFDPLSESQIQPHFLDERQSYYDRVLTMSV